MLNLVPYPSGKVKEMGGFITLPNPLEIDFGVFDENCVKAFCSRNQVEYVSGDFMTLRQNTKLDTEAYVLKVSDYCIMIEASSEIGVIRALTTLSQLHKENRVICCEIEDSPRYVHRGLSLDCARHFFPVTEVKKIIEEISLCKMNVLHWHLSDDQGWRIESKRFPKLQEISTEYYTQEEIRDVCLFAADRGVEIIPEIDMPGHVSALLAAYPEYSCFGEKVKLAVGGGVFPIILCAGNEKTYKFLQELLDEIVPLFPGGRFHIGGDEAPKNEWKKCSCCQEKMKELGLSEYEDLQGWFSSRVAEILKHHGKTAVLWNESLRAKTLPDDVQIQYWTLQHRDSMQPFAEKGGKWIYSDMFELYLDYPYSMTSMEKLYNTTFHLGKKDFSSSNGLLGPEAAIWAEHITDCERLEKLLFPRIFALAETAWSGRRDYGEFCTRLEKVIEDRKDISYTDRSWWDPEGKERRKEAIEYFVSINSGMDKEARAQAVETTAPNKEFSQSFMNKFFRKSDMPALLKSMMKKR